MGDLIKAYSISEILLFVITFALAMKGVVSFWDWGYGRLKQAFQKKADQENRAKSIQSQIDEYKQNYEFLMDSQKSTKESLESLTNKINLLIDSDQDDIKSFITEKHHLFCYQERWIDDYSLECIEKRYQRYKEEGGNSFIDDLMKELRALPKQPPQN